MTVRESSVDFPSTGVVVVHGLNSSAGNKIRSIGSGKSAIGEAISRCLLGVPGRFAMLGHYSPKDAENTYVKLTCSHKGKPLVIEMGYKAPEITKSSEGFRFTYDGQQVWRDNLQNTRDDLVKLLTVPPHLAKWTVHFDGDRLKFNDLSQKTSVDLLMAALNQPPWTDYQRSAQTACDQVKEDVAVSRAGCDRARTQSEEATRDWDLAKQNVVKEQAEFDQQTAENEKRLRQTLASKTAEETALQEAQLKMAALKRQIEEAASVNAKEEHDLEIRRNEINDVVQALQDQRAVISAKTDAALTAVREATKKTRQAVQKDRTIAEGKSDEAIRLKQTALDESLQIEVETRDMLKVKIAGIVSQVNAATQALRKIESAPKNCPTCGKPWDMDTCADQATPLRNDLTTLKSKQKACESLLVAAEAKLLAARKAADGEIAALTDLWDKTLAGIDALVEAENEREQAQVDRLTIERDEALRSVVVELNGARLAAVEAQNALTALRAKSPIQKFSRQCEELEHAETAINRRIEALERQIEQLHRGPSRANLDNSEAIVNERQRIVYKLQKKLVEEAAKLADNEDALQVTSYWQKAFGPNGIPNMILRDAVAPLNSAAKRISAFLAGPALQVTYSMSKELVSGRDKAELSITVKNESGSARLDGSSKGEASLSNLIVAETLAEVGQIANRIGYRFYDEIAANQEEMVRVAISAWLREIAHRYGILTFVVSHSAEAANFADHRLLAEKTSSGTTYRWE